MNKFWNVRLVFFIQINFSMPKKFMSFMLIFVVALPVSSYGRGWRNFHYFRVRDASMLQFFDLEIKEPPRDLFSLKSLLLPQ